MAKGICPLCHNHRALRRSHAVPTAVFRRILRKNNGKAIELRTDSQPIAYSSDSWREYLLCGDCEHLTNKNYDAYAIKVFRGGIGQSTNHANGVTLTGVDLDRFHRFFVSIFWKAAQSQHYAYTGVFIAKEQNEEFRAAIRDNLNLRGSLVSVRVSKLTDDTPNGFTDDDLKDIIVSPFRRRQKTRLVFCFVFEGLFLEIFVPGLKFSERSRTGVLDPKKRVFYIPLLDIFEVPELVEGMAINFKKQAEGSTRIQR